MLEVTDISLKSWSGYNWKIIRLDVLPEVVEEWVLMTPPLLMVWSRVRLLQRVTTCLSSATFLYSTGDTLTAAKS